MIKIKAQISNDTSNVDNAPISKLEQLEEKFNKIYDFETKSLIIRSRVRWLEEGERSSKYFCNLEDRSWQKKNIYSIRDDEGNIILDQASILQNIHNLHSRLYSNRNSSQNEVLDNEAFLNLIDTPKLSDDENDILEQPLSKQELLDVIKTMKTNKTPGYDGLPIEFYIVFLLDISDLLIDAYNFSLQQGVLTPAQRNGIITLLPKKDRDPMYIQKNTDLSLY